MALSLIRITDIREVPSAETGRGGKMDMVIQYVVDNQRIYNLSMHKEDYTPDSAMTRIKSDETERMKLINQQFIVGQ